MSGKMYRLGFSGIVVDRTFFLKALLIEHAGEGQ